MRKTLISLGKKELSQVPEDASLKVTLKGSERIWRQTQAIKWGWGGGGKGATVTTRPSFPVPEASPTSEVLGVSGWACVILKTSSNSAAARGPGRAERQEKVGCMPWCVLSSLFH